MKTRSRWPVAVALVGLAALSGPVRAEVSAETDSSGNYLRTVVLSNASTRNVRIWSVVKSKSTLHPLNPAGDLNGDLWPVIGETLGIERTPWVLWSRYTGAGYDIAYSRWSRAAFDWEPVAWLASPTQPGDDLSPALAFDAGNRPYAAWWRNEGGVGRVYLSLWLVTRWMDEYAVSDPGVDSVNPSIAVLSDSRIQIEYDTPDGHVTRIVGFNRPTTITDDITPFGRMTVEQTSTTPMSSP